MSGQSSPHDGVARLVLGDPKNAASQFRAVLPEPLVARLDLDRLARVDASFADDELSSRYMDVLYTVPLGGREALIYVLMEHQSSTDRLLPFRMLQYLVRIWDWHLTLRPRADQLLALLDQPGGTTVFRALVKYIENVAETPADELFKVFDELGPDAKEAYVTTADMLRAEGRAEMLERQLTVKFGPLPEGVLHTISTATPDQFDIWAERILTADILDDVLR